MGRQLAPLFFAAFLAYGYNNIFMTLTPSFVAVSYTHLTLPTILRV